MQDESWLKIVSAQYGQILSNQSKHQKILRQRDYYGYSKAFRLLFSVVHLVGVAPSRISRTLSPSLASAEAPDRPEHSISWMTIEH